MANKKTNSGVKNNKTFSGGRIDTKNQTTADGAGYSTVSKTLQRAGFTKEYVELKVADILLRNQIETQELRNDPHTTNFDLIIASVVNAAIVQADCGRLDNLLEKIFGKTVHIKGDISVTNTNMDIPLDEKDSLLIQRAIERAVKASE